MLKAIQVGEPVEHRGVVIAPLFPTRTPRAEYVTVDEAIPLGFRVTEVDEAGSVPELKVENPLDWCVLVYDGEELAGGKQNRIANVSALVPAKGEARLPVSCVEQGRWETRTATMSSPRHAAFPALRRSKAERLSAAPMQAGIAQADVWASVAAKSERHGAYSPTGAQADIFQARERDLAALRDAFPLQAGQSGALLVLGQDVSLDYVSRPDAFGRLYPKVVDGYLLDALERLDAEPGRVDGFRKRLESAARSRRPSVALGEDVRLHDDGVVGSALELDGELIQLCAFTSTGEAAQTTRIGRPSRRRA